MLHHLDTALSSAGKGWSTTCPTAFFHPLAFALGSAEVAGVDGDLKAPALVSLLSEDGKGRLAGN